MKVKFHQTAKRLRSISDKPFLLLVFCLILAITINAQSQKTYELEIPVKQGVHIKTNVPTDFNLSCNGTITTDNTYDRFIISGKNGDQRLNIGKELNIHTWDKQVLRQEVMINAHLEDNASAKALLTSLNIEFDEKANGSVLVDANMNFEKFIIENGFLKGDECFVVLANGGKHKINRLEIKTVLYIPKDANLTVEGKRNCTINLDDLEGDLELILSYAEIHGKSVNRLKGNLNYCYNAIFEDVNSAEINAINSYIKMASVNHLDVGKQKISNRCLAPSMQKLKKSNSFQNIFEIEEVGKMMIYESANDEINIKNAYMVDGLEAAFSKFQIEVLHDYFNLNAKNSEVKIFNVKKNFKEINVSNTLGEIFLNIADDSSYQLRLPSENYLECDLDSKFKELPRNGDTDQYYSVGDSKDGSNIYINCDKCKFTIM